eukprot:262726-Pelagomonas_calceolata.AAC.1
MIQEQEKITGEENNSKTKSTPGPTPPRRDDGQGKRLILGESCTVGTLSVTIGSPEQTRSLKPSVKAQESNVSVVVATARVSDNGALAISGACVDVWVCM